jgi:hypothetical protein
VSNRSLDALGTNYVGLESTDTAGSSVLSFAWDGMGHAVADSCVDELRENFRGNVWAHNGPGLVTRVLLKRCNGSRVSYRAAGAACSLPTRRHNPLCSAVLRKPKITLTTLFTRQLSSGT